MKCAKCGSTKMRVYTREAYSLESKGIGQDDIFPNNKMMWEYLVEVIDWVCFECSSEDIRDEYEDEL